MTKSQLFKSAHIMTRQTIKSGDDYGVTFGACIKRILEMSKGFKKSKKKNNKKWAQRELVSNTKLTIGLHSIGEYNREQAMQNLPSSMR